MSFSKDELAEYAAFAERLADAARGETLPRFRSGTKIVEKAGPIFDPVTDADREAERVIRKLIEEAYPAHGVLGEEFGETAGAGAWRWVLDPVDGTRAFMCGASTWTTLIGLEYQGAPVFGLIDQPFTGERWTGFSGAAVHSHGGARRDARTSGEADLSKARISTTDPLPTAYFNADEAAAFARVSNAARVARFSLDAYGYGLLAIGELDIVMESGLQRHDYAALIPVIEGAGGVVTNWRGQTPGTDARGEILAAASPALHAAALSVLKA